MLDLRAVAVRLQQEHTALRDTFNNDLNDPTLPTPPPALYKPVDVSAMIEKLIIKPLDQGKPPDRVHQRDIARTRDYYDLQGEWFHPDVTQCPDRLSPAKKKQYMRDINERNRARGVADFWNDRTTMDVVTGARFSLPYTGSETQWIVAVRRLLGHGPLILALRTPCAPANSPRISLTPLPPHSRPPLRCPFHFAPPLGKSLFSAYRILLIICDLL